MRNIIILPFDLIHHLIEGLNGFPNSAMVLMEGDIRATGFFLRKIEVHFTDLQAGAFFHQVGVDLKLSLKTNQSPSVMGAEVIHIRLITGFKINQFYRVIFSLYEIDSAF